jgi:hypothetical protein
MPETLDGCFARISIHIHLSEPLNLTFANHVHCFQPSDGASSGIERLKSNAWFSESFDEAMILLNDIVQILELP